MKKIAAILAMIPSLAHAGLFAEIGIATADPATCIQDYNGGGRYGCSAVPLGGLAVGYAWRGLSVQVEHWSSLVEKDRGLNLLSVKYRWESGK